MAETTKTCKDCKISKPLESFNDANYEGPDGKLAKTGNCKECQSKYFKSYYEKNKQRIIDNGRRNRELKNQIKSNAG